MKLGTLTLAYEALEILFKASLPIRTSYALSKVIDPLRRELNHVESMRVKLIEKHTHDDTFHRDDFLEDYNELMETEVDLDLPKLPLNDILESDAEITPLGFSILLSLGVIDED